MSAWQFRFLFLVLVIIAGELLVISVQLSDIGTQTREIFSQTRWMTWKLDQSGSARINVDTGK